jgi:hypothetical protein
MLRIGYTIFLLLQTSFVLAQQSAIDFITDEVMEAFPESVIVSSSYTPAAIHQIALGILQGISGVAVPEETKRVSGALTKTLYEIPREYSGEDVYRFFQRYFEEKSFERLFVCTGRACGSSNDWANDIFKNRILYGPAQNQYYSAYQMPPGNPVSPYVTVYIITRGNRRIYAYVEVTELAKKIPSLPTATKGKLAVELLENGYSVLQNITFQADGVVERTGLDALIGQNDVAEHTGLEALIEMLRENPLLEVYIVSHLTADVKLEALQRRSQKRADSVVQQLLASGISQARVSAHGVGPLVPNCTGEACRNRVEVVLR